jgi:hypothetical protein
MRPVPVPTREELGEGGWIIAAVGTVINPVFAEKRLNNNVTAKKTRKVPCLETGLFEASKIL